MGRQDDGWAYCAPVPCGVVLALKPEMSYSVTVRGSTGAAETAARKRAETAAKVFMVMVEYQLSSVRVGV